MRHPRLTRRLLRGLTPRQRKVLYLRIEEHKTFLQIARELGLRSKATAWQHYRYAMAKARVKADRRFAR